ncbi:hypothetical protein NBZ79_10065 [Sneathiella marina]|uniref:Uncharacterized protein n=1 Tax=Sneathiella marina TaxID=2950108 RepID=A0ABY4VX77_9PROT|nr:hypothetical protein [Sneathiella marina]USG59533.1 hypothetical protein NBZ79_10065 [Sneathiella marina]
MIGNNLGHSAPLGEMEMRMNKLTLVFILILGACTSFGPSPKDEDYTKALKNVPDANETMFIASVRFVQPDGEPTLYKGQLVTPTEVFFGRLLVTPSKLIIVIYDEESSEYITIFKIRYSEIDNFSAIREPDKSITFHLEVEEEIYWISGTFPLDRNGEEVESGEVREYIHKRLPESTGEFNPFIKKCYACKKS